MLFTRNSLIIYVFSYGCRSVSPTRSPGFLMPPPLSSSLLSQRVLHVATAMGSSPHISSQGSQPVSRGPTQPQAQSSSKIVMAWVNIVSKTRACKPASASCERL